LNVGLGLEGDLAVTADVAEDLLHLVLVVARQVLPQLDKHGSKLEFNVVTGERHGAAGSVCLILRLLVQSGRHGSRLEHIGATLLSDFFLLGLTLARGEGWGEASLASGGDGRVLLKVVNFNSAMVFHGLHDLGRKVISLIDIAFKTVLKDQLELFLDLFIKFVNVLFSFEDSE
jgi:hypothetical protein